jgi:hypothetical protein
MVDKEQEMKYRYQQPKIVHEKLEQKTTRLVADFGILEFVDIDSVNGWDDSHFPWGDPRWKKQDKIAEEHKRPEWTELHHKEGAEKLKDLIKQGAIIRPILVFDGFKREILLPHQAYVDIEKVRYQRLDGFKRWIALKELGYKYILVQIITTYVGAGQQNQSWVL